MVKVKVIYDYDATQPDELTIKNGDIINDVKKLAGGWWEGILNGQRGVFPDNFVEDYNGPPVSEPPKGPKPGGGGKVSEMQKQIAGQIKLGPPPPMKSGPKPKQMAVVLFEYKPEQPDELELNEGDEVEIVRMAEEGWWEGVLRGKTGMFPSNFVKLMDTAHAPTPPPVASAYIPGLPKQNDIGLRAPLGGRPPAEKKNMPPPASVEPAYPPLLPKRNRGAKARVVYSYKAMNEDELTLDEGQIILVTDQKLDDPGWWKGELNSKAGVFPDNFVELLPDDEQAQPPPVQPLPTRGAAPRRPSVRLNKAPPQPPQEVQAEQPVRLPPRPSGHIKQEMASSSDSARVTTPPMSKPKMEPEPMRQQPMINGGVDEKVVMALRDELENMKESVVTRESYELLQRELKATKETLDSYKKENNKKLLDLMKEIDDERKQSVQINIELARIRKLAEEHWMGK